MKKFKKTIGENYLLVGLIVAAVVIWFIFGLLGARLYDCEKGALILCWLGAFYLGKLLALFMDMIRKWGDE